jgi:UDP:flavonoid glycosyltransferase YjiC (YdhE family)
VEQPGSEPAGTIAYFTLGIFGYLYRFLPIARELERRGHRVVLITHSATAVEHARAAGLEAVHLAEEAAARDAIPLASWPGPVRPVLRRIPGIARGPRGRAIAEATARRAHLLDASEFEGVLRDLRPVLVLTEIEEHRAIRVVKGMGLPLALFEDLYNTRPDPDVPFPARSHQVPTGSAGSRRRALRSWNRWFREDRIRERADRWWLKGNDWHGVMAEMAERSGMAPGDVDRRYHQYYDYPGTPLIRTVAPELGLPGDRRRPTITGPIVDLDRPTHGVDDDFAATWERLSSRPAGTRVAFVSLGTFLEGQVDFVRKVVDALAALPGLELVVSVGRDRERWRSIDVPPNVHVFGRVPQMQVLAGADVVVGTGGPNTTHEALWFGVPLLHVPLGIIDSRGTAALVVYHGVGRRLRPSEAKPDRLAAEVKVLLDDPSYRQRAAAMGEKIRAWDGIRRAADEIQRLAAG